MKRIVVTGAAGSGKSTLAARLAAVLGYPFIEPDALFWGPNWTPAPRDEFRNKIANCIAGDTWTIGGNYSVARDLIWRRADTLIWLDYPLPFVLWRLSKRTLRRIITQEALWGGNVESWRGQFASRDSLFVFAAKTHHRQRREMPILLTQPEYAHLYTHRFRQPDEAEKWLCSLHLSAIGGE
ncbi:MAG TPA: adenylate kinase [Chloroflexi bacterium]|nr:adenylate kinase [Chloroflexota bacterium]HHW87227.1 adenylate kinase [Chloroflexota bacterium]